MVIIDQPEDDLDNQTIYDDVIKIIRAMKPRTQFIFATHKAKIPALGDAENVCACEYSDGKIQAAGGGVDAPLVQLHIISVMEGGRPSNGAGKFTAHGSVEPDAILFHVH